MLVVTSVRCSQLAPRCWYSLRFHVAEGRGLVEQSRDVRLASLPLLEDIKRRGRVKGKQLQKVHIESQGSMVIKAVWPFV